MNSTKWENATGTTILIVVGICAGTVSFTHVIAWTIMYGQPVLVGMVNAFVTELLQIAAGLEIKRRRRTGRTGWRAFWFPSAVLGLACSMSLIAQLSQASPSWQGRLVATLPMIGFLFTVKLVMGRSPAVPSTAAVPAADTQPRPLVVDNAPDESPSPSNPSHDGTVPVPPMHSRLGTEALAADPMPVPVRPSPLVTGPPIDEPRPVVPVDPPAVPVPPAAVRPSRPALASVPSGQAALDIATPTVRPTTQTSDRPALSGASPADIPADVQQTAAEVFHALHAQDGRVTRDRLVTVLRDQHNISISNARAGALLKWMREELISA